VRQANQRLDPISFSSNDRLAKIHSIEQIAPSRFAPPNRRGRFPLLLSSSYVLMVMISWNSHWCKK
jgi:hypothetical protein